MRSIGALELLIVWLVALALPALLLFFVWRSYRLSSKLCDDTAAIRRALARDART